MRAMKVLDLFSGIGGFSLGLERAGMETIAFCEQDEYCQKVLKKHWPHIPIFDDVRELKATDLEWSMETFNEINIICGGFPCQDISIAGKKKGLKGERSGLWKEYKRLIEEVKPKYAIIENVANLRSNGLSAVIKDLWEIGYQCEWHIISASSVGAIHKRERIWIIAYPDSEQLWEQQGRRVWKERKNSLQLRVDGEKRTSNSCSDNAIPDSSSIGFDECSWKKRFIQADKEWDSEKVHAKGTQRKFELRKNGTILSERDIKDIRSAYSEQWGLVSRVHRVTNGLSKKMERDRKNRIKALGNAVVPQIPELIGKAIIDYENRRIGDEIFN